MSKNERLPAKDVQEWIDNTNISCGDCGSSSLTVKEILYKPLSEFGSISPHKVKLECEDCGGVTENSLKDSAVEEITS